jgi:hypothetical protein
MKGLILIILMPEYKKGGVFEKKIRKKQLSTKLTWVVNKKCIKKEKIVRICRGGMVKNK